MPFDAVGSTFKPGELVFAAFAEARDQVFRSPPEATCTAHTAVRAERGEGSALFARLHSNQGRD